MAEMTSDIDSSDPNESLENMRNESRNDGNLESSI